jgi:hypothetical protein
MRKKELDTIIFGIALGKMQSKLRIKELDKKYSKLDLGIAELLYAIYLDELISRIKSKIKSGKKLSKKEREILRYKGSYKRGAEILGIAGATLISNEISKLIGVKGRKSKKITFY